MMHSMQLARICKPHLDGLGGQLDQHWTNIQPTSNQLPLPATKPAYHTLRLPVSRSSFPSSRIDCQLLLKRCIMTKSQTAVRNSLLLTYFQSLASNTIEDLCPIKFYFASCILSYCTSLQQMPSIIIVTVAGVAAVYFFLLALAYFKHDPREPEAILGTIPFISPLIGMLTEKGHYYIRLRCVRLYSILAVQKVQDRSTYGVI